MPASMMIAASCVALNVIGNSSDIAPTGPMPGSTPMSVPMNTPMKQYMRFDGCNATAKPSPSCWRSSIKLSDPELAGRELCAEPDPEDDVGEQRASDSAANGDVPALRLDALEER